MKVIRCALICVACDLPAGTRRYLDRLPHLNWCSVSDQTCRRRTTHNYQVKGDIGDIGGGVGLRHSLFSSRPT